jgi:nitroreductase
MDVFKAIQWRRSVRDFAEKKIETGKIEQILEAARLAPSSCNSQSWHFIVIDDPALITQIPQQVALGDQMIVKWLKKAPCVIAGCYTQAILHKISRMFDHNNHLIDISIAMTHMCLAATALGIGSCFVGWFHTKKLKKLLGLPARYQIATLLVLGYPSSESDEQGIAGIQARPRKKLDEIISYNKYGNTLGTA